MPPMTLCPKPRRRVEPLPFCKPDQIGETTWESYTDAGGHAYERLTRKTRGGGRVTTWLRARKWTMRIAVRRRHESPLKCLQIPF